MNPDHAPSPGSTSPPWPDLVRRHVAGDRAAADEIASALAPGLAQAAARFLGPDDPDVADVVSESLLAVLDYLVRRGGFEGNLPGFAVTVASNRCRNVLAWRRRRRQVPLEPLAHWIADPGASALDHLLADERTALLQRSLGAVGPECEHLLRAHYLQRRPMTELQAELGLGSVQAVYYRRAACLEKICDILNRLLGRCSDGDDCPPERNSPGGGDP